MQKYVLGFIFNEDMSNVVLIEKQKPEWQKGHLNGIGGKIEDGETPLYAIIRECQEETGANIENWKHYCVMRGINNDSKDFEVECFYTVGNHLYCRTKEIEIVNLYSISDILINKYKTIGNLSWLISLAIDFEISIHPPKKATIEY